MGLIAASLDQCRRAICLTVRDAVSGSTRESAVQQDFGRRSQDRDAAVVFVKRHDQDASGACHRLRRLHGWLVRPAHGGGKTWPVKRNGNAIRVYGARLLRRLHGRTVTDGLFQTKVTARQSAAELRRQNIWTFVRLGILGVVFASLAGVGIVSAARAAMLLLGVANENTRHSDRTG